MSSFVECPLCGVKTTEMDVNRHLDKGCPHSKKSDSLSPPCQEKTVEFRANEPTRLNGYKRPSIEDSNDNKQWKSKPTIEKKVRLSTVPLAEQIRPRTLDDFIGQDDLVGEHGLLRKFLENDICPSLILWGPSGVGKTSFARILAKATKSRFIEVSAASQGIAECKKIFEEAKNDLQLMGRKTILFLDEIHRFNKAQQDIFLPYVERGDITLIGATTENPSFRVNGALISRCRVFVLHKLEINDLRQLLKRAISIINNNRIQDGLSTVELEDETIEYLAGLADGDGRIAINVLEITLASIGNVSATEKTDSIFPRHVKIDNNTVKKLLQRTHLLYDRVGDSHYDTISAFHKSVRGSDPDATLFYLGRMLESGEDPLYVARRMVRIASEDIGLADDNCLPFAVAAYTAVQQIGMPEADCILAHCATKLAMAPKSVKVYKGYGAVKELLRTDPAASAAVVPIHLRNAPTKLMKDIGYGKDYKYNPDYEDGRVEQTYMPDGLEQIKFLPLLHLGEKIDDDLRHRQ